MWASAGCTITTDAPTGVGEYLQAVRFIAFRLLVGAGRTAALAVQGHVDQRGDRLPRKGQVHIRVTPRPSHRMVQVKRFSWGQYSARTQHVVRAIWCLVTASHEHDPVTTFLFLLVPPAAMLAQAREADVPDWPVWRVEIIQVVNQRSAELDLAQL